MAGPTGEWTALPPLPTLGGVITNRVLLAAIAALALTAGLVTAHDGPSAPDQGLTTAALHTSHATPWGHGVDGPLSEQGANTHGEEVSAAAQGETPEGWKNHGAYVSSIAKGWGAEVSAQHDGGVPD